MFVWGSKRKLLTNLGTQLAGEGHFLAKKPTFCTFDEVVGLGGGGRWGPARTFRLIRIRQFFYLLFFSLRGHGGLVGLGCRLC